MAFTSNKMQQDVAEFISTRVEGRKQETSKNIEIVLEVLKEIFSKLTIHEPRFHHKCQFDGERVLGMQAITPNHIEFRIYLDQIEMFRVSENGAPDGATFLDLKDEVRKDCCIWSEFLTAAGHLSARKVREKFQLILHQALNRITWMPEKLYVTQQKASPRLYINEDIILDIYPSFRCTRQWPMDVKIRSVPATTRKQHANEPFEFELVAMEVGSSQPYSTDRDAWKIDFSTSENRVIGKGNRRLCLSILKTVSNRNWQEFSTVISPYALQTVFMYVCEKHVKEEFWNTNKLPERINAVLLQLVACLQSRCLPHYYLKGINLLEGKSSRSIKAAVEEMWKYARELCTNKDFFSVI
eukprot:gene7275-8086_t